MAADRSLNPHSNDDALKVVVDSARRYILVSDSVCDLLGYTREQLLNMRIDDISGPTGAHTPVVFEHFVKSGKMTGTYLLRRADGTSVTIRYEAEALPDGTFAAEWTVVGEHDRRRRSRGGVRENR